MLSTLEGEGEKGHLVFLGAKYCPNWTNHPQLLLQCTTGGLGPKTPPVHTSHTARKAEVRIPKPHVPHTRQPLTRGDPKQTPPMKSQVRGQDALSHRAATGVIQSVISKPQCLHAVRSRSQGQNFGILSISRSLVKEAKRRGGDKAETRER